jgi:hypothetical protein
MLPQLSQAGSREAPSASAGPAWPLPDSRRAGDHDESALDEFQRAGIRLIGGRGVAWGRLARSGRESGLSVAALFKGRSFGCRLSLLRPTFRSPRLQPGPVNAAVHVAALDELGTLRDHTTHWLIAGSTMNASAPVQLFVGEGWRRAIRRTHYSQFGPTRRVCTARQYQRALAAASNANWTNSLLSEPRGLILRV